MSNNKIFIIILFVSLFLSTQTVLLAERTIRGTITHPCSNKGFSGALVKAFDSDGATRDDFMGQSYTNASGRYTITYRGGHWDPAPHRVTKWRPDIYVVVYLKQKGKWRISKKSRIFSNHKLKRDLTINLKAKYPDVPGGGIGTVYGIIKNAYTGKPVPAAKVCMKILRGQTKCVNSKADGGYILNTLPGQCLVLKITAIGYRPVSIPGISVVSGGYHNVPAKLIPIRRRMVKPPLPGNPPLE